MIYRVLGKTNLKVSALGLGAAELGRPEVEEPQVERLLHGALDLGINFIDTAAMYELSEERIGRYLHGRRDEFILATKCGDYNVVEGGVYRTEVDFSAEGILRTISESRKKLRMDVLDLVLFHGMPNGRDARKTAIEALLSAQGKGWVRFIGASVDEPPGAEEDLWLPDVQEFTYNILEQDSARSILPALEERHMGAVIKRPIANAVYLLASCPEGTYYASSWERAQRLDLCGLAGGMPPAEFALRFVLAHPSVDSAIVGTTRLEHLEANARACDEVPLSTETVQRARSAFARLFGTPGG